MLIVTMLLIAWHQTYVDEVKAELGTFGIFVYDTDLNLTFSLHNSAKFSS